MSLSAKAILSWIPHVAGGRRELPTIPVYTAVARFRDSQSGELTCDWSLVTRFEEEPRYGHDTVVRISFLAPDAPVELLVPGFQFDLLEGSRVVAHGRIVG